MANTKSADKRWRQSLKRRLRNRIAVGAARTAVRDTVRSIRAGSPDGDKLQQAIRALDKAAQKGIIHKNNAARRKSRLMRQYNVVAAGGVVEPVHKLPSRARTRTGAARRPRTRR